MLAVVELVEKCLSLKIWFDTWLIVFLRGQARERHKLNLRSELVIPNVKSGGLG